MVTLQTGFTFDEACWTSFMTLVAPESWSKLHHFVFFDEAGCCTVGWIMGSKYMSPAWLDTVSGHAQGHVSGWAGYQIWCPARPETCLRPARDMYLAQPDMVSGLARDVHWDPMIHPTVQHNEAKCVGTASKKKIGPFFLSYLLHPPQ